MIYFPPLIDIGPYVSGGPDVLRKRVALSLDAALGRNTLVQVVGHEVPASIITALDAAAENFFSLDESEKRRSLPPAGSWRGYVPPASEALGRSIGLEPENGVWDGFEAFDLGSSADDYPRARTDPSAYTPNIWPDLPDFARLVNPYFDEAGRVARTMLEIVGDALGLGRGFFRPLTNHSIDIMRLAQYDNAGMGAHTDFGLLTVLRPGDGGLEVAGAEATWRPVHTQPGALVIMVGDLLSRLVDERWLPTLHRVMPTGGVRRSVAYYHEGNADAEIVAIPALLAPGQVAKHAPTTVAAHIGARASSVHPGGTVTRSPGALARLPRA